MCLHTYSCAYSCSGEYGRDSINESHHQFDDSTPTSNEEAEGGVGGVGGGGLIKKAPEALDILHSSQVLHEVPQSTRT